MRSRAFLDGPLRAFVERALDAAGELAGDLSRPGGEATVLAVRTSDGRRPPSLGFWTAR